MTKQTKELSLNQTNMIELAYMLNDVELGKLLDDQYKFVVGASKANIHIIEYTKSLYKRLRREAEAVIESISKDEIYDRTQKMFETHERLSQVNKDIVEGIRNDEEVKDYFTQHINKITPRVNERKGEFKEIVAFYKSL
jgi:hypothetical protein|uniref:Uncharacterized protein n=1 Tax=Siphoviridae sp. ctuBK6 TaxID=2827963 RepID=A0A8S5THZ9_9CAUD|nr:MAG TPA: hypothetical protein [Siphoviridae sp. ctuBK6]